MFTNTQAEYKNSENNTRQTCQDYFLLCVRPGFTHNLCEQPNRSANVLYQKKASHADYFLACGRARYEKSINVIREEKMKLEREKHHVYRISMFGNSKEIRNRMILIGQSTHLLKLGEFDEYEGFAIIENNVKQELDILDIGLDDLEESIKEFAFNNNR